MNKLSKSLIIVMLIVSESSCKEEEKACPSILISPHANFTFSKPLSKLGTYQINIVKPDSEKCNLIIESINPEIIMGAMVQNPTSEYKMNCKSMGVAGLTKEGFISGFKAGGTNEDWKWEMKKEGKLIASWEQSLSYEDLTCPNRTIANAIVTITEAPD